MAKKKLTIEDVLVPKEEIPYEVPENWCWVKLGGLVDEVKNGTTIKQNKDEIGPKVTRIESVQNNKIDFNRIGYITEQEKIKESDWYEAGDIALSHINSIEHVGKTALIEENYLPLVHGMNLLRIRLKKELINPKYFAIYTQGYDFKSEVVDRVNRAVNQVSLNQKRLNEIPITVPPLAEQVRIVNIIESLFDKVDMASSLVDEARDGFEKRRAAILERAFSGELTRQWREENSVSDDSEELLNSIKEERLSICQSKKEKSDITKMFEEDNFIDDKYPKGWLNLKANMICHNITCGKTPSGKVCEEKGEIPFLKVANIVDNKVDFMYKPQYIDKETNDTKLKSSIVIPGDVIMNIVGPPLRKVAIVQNDYSEWNINQNIARFRTISKVLPKYVYYCLIHEETLREALNLTRGVVGQIIINVSIVRTLNIPIPSIQEQKEVVRLLDNMLNNENKVEELTCLDDSIDNIKKSILAKAFRSELGSNEMNEESSIELLKEIIK